MSTPIISALQKEIKTNELQAHHHKRQAHSHKSHAAIHASKARELKRMLSAYKKTSGAKGLRPASFKKMPTVKWNKCLLPYLKLHGPATVDKIVNALFPGKHKATKRILFKRVASILTKYKKDGVIKSEGARGTKGKANMRFSMVK